MQEVVNPYASALDGLDLPDPVQSFFDFCIERERIRIRRAEGQPSPWSEDPIFQQGRFLNVFREDDRGTKAILRLLEPVANDVEALVHAAFFARWCNRDSTIDGLRYGDLQDVETLRRCLMNVPHPPWCNVTAYPVEPIEWNGTRYSRFSAAVELFPRIRETLATIIEDSQRDVIRATEAINKRFNMQNDFPIFMAVMDVAWFRPDLIDPGSHVPTGIGAAPYLDRLQAHLGLSNHHETCDAMIGLQATYWPEAKRRFAPIDIEYLSCECRKYFSYKNGTKRFEGKNRFHPGESPWIEFDVSVAPEKPTGSQIHVIAGGPCSGKTTLLKELKRLGFTVKDETAEVLLRDGVSRGTSAEEMRADPVRWQQDVLAKDHALFENLSDDQLIFTDTSFIEDVVFSRRAGIRMGPNTMQWLQNKRYAKVFFLESLDTHEVTEVRTESQALARKISREVEAEYARYGYPLIRIPACAVSERVEQVLRSMENVPD